MTFFISGSIIDKGVNGNRGINALVVGADSVVCILAALLCRESPIDAHTVQNPLVRGESPYVSV